MAKVLVSGLINLETTLRVDRFPMAYRPVQFPFFGVKSTISGVGYNVAKALSYLGEEVRFVSLVGGDDAGTLAYHSLQKDQIAATYVLPQLEQTAQSVILYELSGKRMIFTDLKDVQERVYPAERFVPALTGADLAVLCNINFSRPFLSVVKSAGIPIATDVHTISDFQDPYNRDFMAAADILFMSHERLPVSPEAGAEQLMELYNPQILVIGLGGDGALLAVRKDGYLGRVPAVNLRPIVNTIGAGDALFSCFVHTYLTIADPYTALHHALLFAAYKIGTTGGAEGFLTAEELARLFYVERRP